jgi:histidyl-tRNA synthetase
MSDMKAPRGTQDLMGYEVRAWDHLQAVADKLFGAYGFQMIKTPLFEQTNVFTRGIGESTDVVGKEMFHVLSEDAFRRLRVNEELKHDQELALRPENTASIVRAVIEHNLVPTGAAPVKFRYAGSMFRCERPQKGRLREFNQIGAECIGASQPTADAELIIMLMQFFEQLGIPKSSLRLLLNSMGDEACRPAYREKVRAFIEAHSDEMCDECNRRKVLNPLRVFDCKNPGCRAVMAAAPLIPDELCCDCRSHYAQVKALLDDAGIAYEEDPRLVRGLDYYTRTVFEVQAIDGLGSQNALGGGGRYDRLMEHMGGQPTPSLGFALGFERTLLALEAAGVRWDEEHHIDVFVAVVDESCRSAAFSLMQNLRAKSIRVDMDHQGRSLKSQFKVADKTNAPYCVIIGPDELAAGQIKVRAMDSHEEKIVAYDDASQYMCSLLK